MAEILLEDNSTTYEALSIIYENLESEADTFKSFLTSKYLMESGASNDIVMEGVTDVFKSIVNGIKKFIQAIKDFFKKILLYITSAYQDLDKVATEVEKVIKDKNINFKIDGYKFTVVGKNGPNMDEFRRIVSEYNSDMDKVSELKKSEIKDVFIEWLSDDNLNKLRAEVLGVSNLITEDDYNDEIRKHYRDGEDTTHEISVDNSYVRGIISNAKHLEDTKKSAIKDRDNLISLLSKTENFFDKTLQTYYKGSQKKADVNKVNVDDDKFSTETRTVDTSNSINEVITTYASYKSKQVNKIGSMINMVASERVNALKDQIKQERTILRKCLFGDTDNGSNKSDVAETYIADIPVDYSIYAIESSIATENIYQNAIGLGLLEETEFLLKSIEDGEVYRILEADTAKMSGKVKQTISNIIEMVIKSFRQKAMGSDEFNKAWIEDITKPENKLEEKAKAKSEFTMTNFFGVKEATRNTMVRNLKSAISTSYKSEKYDDASWATSILPSLKTMEDVRDTNTRTTMLNYYRTGKADAELEKKTMNGSELASRIKEMTEYILNYAGKVTKPTEELSSAIKSASEAFKVTESWAPDTYLSIIGRSIMESDVIMCKDFDSVFGVMEETGTGAEQSVNNTAAAAKPESTSNKEADKASNQNATSIQSEDDPKKAEELKNETKEKTNTSAVAYKKALDNFFKNCITLYLKAREEQYIAYKKALASIDGENPKKDKNGKYIPKSERKANKDKEE